MSKAIEQIDLLFETSWEVCNKIGGIYTVLSTKAKTLQKQYKDKVIFIGPDVWTEENPSPYFIESKTLLKEWKNKVLLPNNLNVRVGRWDIPGKPIVVLVKFDTMYSVKDEFYGRMWDLYKVDSIHAYGDYNEACAFSHAAGIVIESICKYKNIESSTNVIAHFDEWTTGMGLLYLKSVLPNVATIFTTHATSIGRSICGNNKPLYDYLPGYNGDQMAGELNMQSKHSLEKTAAHNSDCFTTVSDVTAIECKQLLELNPHIVTPNGFEPNFVPAKNKFMIARNEARNTLLNVATSLTGMKYDNDNTFIIATSGRCEYRNKGIDVYLDSLSTLNKMELDKKVLAFVMVPAWVKEPRIDLTKSINLKRKNRLDNPIITHELNNTWEDSILKRIQGIGFSNDKNNNITVIYVPCYLNGNDGIFNATYYDLLIGMDATVFPSYYEPWGYTPLESIAFGVPTITTTLSGFGQWILSAFDNSFSECGVNVISRKDGNYCEVVENIARSLRYLINSDENTMKEVNRASINTAKQADWSNFIDYYTKAYEIALNNAIKRNNN